MAQNARRRSVTGGVSRSPAEQRARPSGVRSPARGAQARDRIAIVLVLVAAVIGCFFPVLGNEFVNLDDPAMFTGNPYYRGFSGSNLRWMFSTFHLGHYQPLSWLTLALDHALWGLDPRGYHLTNLLLHAANAVLVYLLAERTFRLAGAAQTNPPGAALLGALLFAVHPLRVESVAWATERRDVLSGFFLLVALLAWLRRFDPGLPGWATARWYGIALASFVLSLLSKAWGMTLPVVLLVLDVWPLGRLRGGSERYTPVGRLLLEKVPFAVIALGFAIVAALAQQSAGAMLDVVKFSPWQRLAQAAYGLCFYVVKSLLPVRLSPVYLLDRNLDPTAPLYLASAAAVAVGVTALVLSRRRWPAGLVALLCYAITVAPVLGVAQSGVQIAADRYSYLACLPFPLLLGAGFGRFAPASTAGRVARVLALAVVATLGVLTWRQTFVWRDSLSFWNHVLALAPEHWYGHHMRGIYFYETGETERALADFDAALRSNPDRAQTYVSRGTVRARRGDTAGAIADWDRALEINPGFFAAYYNRGTSRLARGDLANAAADFRAAVRIQPSSHLAWHGLATAGERLGNVDEAIAAYRRALEAAPASWVLRGRTQQALAALEAGRRRDQKRSTSPGP